MRRIPEAHLHQWLLLLLLRPDSGLRLTSWERLPVLWPLMLTQEGPEQEQWATYCLRRTELTSREDLGASPPWSPTTLGGLGCKEPTDLPLHNQCFPCFPRCRSQQKSGRENREVPAKRRWEAKVLAPTSKAGNQVEEPWPSGKPTKAACQWIAEKTGWWPVE